MTNFNMAQGLSKLLQMESDNHYFCNYPNDQDPMNINTADSLNQLIPDGVSSTLVRYTMPHVGDLVSELFFSSTEEQDFSIQIIIGGYLIYSINLHNTKFYRITPSTGIPLIGLTLHGSYIYLKGDNVKDVSILQRTLYLSSPDRHYLVTNKIEMLDGDFIENGKYHSNKNEWVGTYVINNTQFYNEYVCDYPNNPLIKDIKVPTYSFEELSLVKNKNFQEHYDFNIINYSGIINSFTVEGNIELLEIKIGNHTVYTQDCFNGNLNTITPFTFGIPQMCLEFHDVQVLIIASSLPKLYSCVSLLKNDDILRISKLSLDFGDITFKDGMIHKNE